MSRPSGPNKRFTLRRVLRVLGCFILIVLLCYGTSNLWLSSRWGTGMMETKLKERTNLDWKVGSITWSPWNGVTVRDAQMLQPEDLREHVSEPVISVGSMRVEPYWRQLLRGRIKLREVTMDSPKLTVTVEMLASLASNIKPQDALSRQVATSHASQAEPKDTTQQNPKQSSSSQPRPEIVKSAPLDKPKPKTVVRPAAGLPLRLKVSDASLHIVSVSKDIELLSVTGVSLDLPIYGEDSEGVVKIEGMKIPGLPEAVDLEQTVVWKRPYLKIEDEGFDTGGLKVHFLGQLAMGRNTSGRFPFLFDLAIDPQQLHQVKWFERLALQVEAKQLAGRFRLNGSLLSPISWRADMLLTGDGVLVKEEHGSHDVVFDEVALPAVFRQGQLRWSGLRFIGEDISVLGNGKASVSDGLLSVTRLVVSPEVATMLRRGLAGSHIVRSGVRWWDDLDTPDRKMRDLVASGSLTEPMVDAGCEKSNLPVFQVVVSTLNFIREEMKEEGIELQPIPNGGFLKGVSHENH